MVKLLSLSNKIWSAPSWLLWFIMKGMRKLYGAFCLTVAVVACVKGVSASFAEGYRYMDSAGTLHFVDSPDQIPRRYRAQVFPPTPTPVLDKRAQVELQRAKERAEGQRLQAERAKRREAERRQAELDRQRQREDRELRRREAASAITRAGD